MQAIWETYENDGLMVLGVGNGVNEAGCQTWITTHSLTHPVLADPTSVVYPQYGDGYIPYNAIIDGDGELLYGDSGYDEVAVLAAIEYGLFHIDHVPLKDSEDNVNPFLVECTISAFNAVDPGEQVLHWNRNGGAFFNDVSLTAVGGTAYTEAYTAEIPAQNYGTTIYYYLSAADTTARTAAHPVDAPTELHSFYVGVDPTPPVIGHSPMGNVLLADWPATVNATVTDNQGVGSVTLEFSVNGGSTETVSMALQRDGIYTADFIGSVTAGDFIEYWITAVDVAMTPNTTVDPASGYHTFRVVETKPVFIYEPDGAPLSGAAIATELDAMGIDYGWDTTLAADLTLYESIFVCLGVYSDNYALTLAEGQALADFLDTGGRVYMEGGDTWAYDDATAVHPYFGISGLSDGAGDAGPISGEVGTFTEGMSFAYSGANSYIDKIAPLGTAEAVLLNLTPAYTNGVANDGGTYRTVGASIQFGGLTDTTAPSTKFDLLKEILEFFGITPPLVFEDDFESGDDSEWSSSTP